MNISKNWLSAYIDLDGLSSGEMADLLTHAGVEVEALHECGISSDSVVVAQVMQKTPVEGSDHLNVCMVDTGEGAERQIVCGAQNYQVGDKVPCALPGAVLPGGWQIKESKMMGHASCGMLCAASELGLPDKEHGLWILPQAYAVGTPVRSFTRSDSLFELEITPNRPDLLSHWGMARELAGITGRVLKDDPGAFLPETRPAGESIRLSIPEKCPYYTVTRISGVKIAPSPDWLAERLLAIGLHPINNVVDITNYCLFELGHPLHAFDAAQVQGALDIRPAREGESFTSLMDEVYELQTDDLLVSDATGNALALAGVMGGKTSGVTEHTTDILLESAWFLPSAVRRTSRRLGLGSDSSYRFERGAAAWNVLRAAGRAVQLILECAGGTAQPTLVAGCAPCVEPVSRPEQATVLYQGSDAKVSFPLPRIYLDWQELDVMCDAAIPHPEAERILRNLGLNQPQPQFWDCPPWRLDLHRSCDLLEEVVRVYGIDNIPAKRTSIYVPESPHDRAHDYRCRLSHLLAGAGFREVQTFKLIAEQSVVPTIASVQNALPIKPLLPGDVIRVALPLSEDHAVLRPSLAPGLLAVAARNINQGTDVLRFFECGRVFRNTGGGKGKDIECEVLGILMVGNLSPASWDNLRPRPVAPRHLTAVLESLLPKLPVNVLPAKLQRPCASITADILVNGQSCGLLACVAPGTCRSLGLPTACYYAELDLRKLQQLTTAPFKVQELPLYPGSGRDVSLDVPASMQHAEIQKAILGIKQKLLVSCRLKDVYIDPTGEKLPRDRKAMTYSLLYRNPAATLTAREVDSAHGELLKALALKLPKAKYR